MNAQYKTKGAKKVDILIVATSLIVWQGVMTL